MGFGFGLFAQVLDGTDQKAARAAGGIQDGFAQARIDLFDDELGDASEDQTGPHNFLAVTGEIWGEDEWRWDRTRLLQPKEFLLKSVTDDRWFLPHL